LKTYYTLNNWSVEGIQAGSYASGVQRFQDDGIKHVKEFIFVMYTPHNNENGYEYISIKTPFDEMEDNYYTAYTSKGTIKIYYSRTYGIVDLREVPMTLKNILYRKP
jgi:hypothetical protein